jgi:hypothetical protein
LLADVEVEDLQCTLARALVMEVDDEDLNEGG